MTMTDPIADMLTRIRNANSAQFETVSMPGSKLKASLAGILEREGFIAGYRVEPNAEKPGTTLEITMKYSADRTRTIAGIKRISKPGLRIYAAGRRHPACARRHGGGRPFDQPGPRDRSRSPQAPPGRRGALPCLVAPRHVRGGEG